MQARRGRPPGRLIDPTPPDGTDFDGEIRAGWLLRSWRTHILPGSSTKHFARLLVREGCSADASRVSRWETGRIPAPLDVVAGYERVLDLGSGGLVALTIITRKLADPTASLATILETHRVSPARYERALDAIVDGRPSGEEWLEFASFVACHPERALLPVSLWLTVTTRLVHELALAVGTAYITRNEAALALGEHPRARQALVRSVGQYVTRSESLLAGDAIALLETIADRSAGDLVLDLLEEPPGATRSGAARSASVKLVRDQFDEAQLERLEGIVTRWVEEGALEPGEACTRTADLVAALPEDMSRRIGRTIQFAPRLAAVKEVVDPGRIPAAATRLSPVVARVDDPMVVRLVEEALFHGHAERRFHASFCLTLSPFRGPVAAGAAEAIEGALFGSGDDAALVERLLVLMTFVATDAQRELLRRVAEGPQASLRPPALTALAHLPFPAQGRPPALRGMMYGLGRGEDSTVRSALYCAGMTGDPALDDVAGDDAAPPWVRRTADWWSREGPAIHEKMGA